MKNFLMIGLLCLTFFASQETFAQETSKNIAQMTREEAISFLNQNLSELKGKKVSYHNELYINASLKAVGNKITLKYLRKVIESSFKFVSFIHIFNPARIKSTRIVYVPEKSFSYIDIVFDADLTTYFKQSINEQELDIDPFENSETNLAFAYSETDARTKGIMIEKALLRLKELPQPQLPDPIATQETKKSEPTLTETMSWLQTKFRGFVTSAWRGIKNKNEHMLLDNFKKDSVKFDDCEMSFESYDSNLKTDFGGSIFLSDLDSSRIESRKKDSESQWGLVINSKNNKDEFILGYHSFYKEYKDTDLGSSSMLFKFLDENVRDRVVVALKAAIKQCGGDEKKEPF